jgi:hypothetical protein
MVTIAAPAPGLDAGRGDDQDPAAAARRLGHRGQLPPRLHCIEKGDTERARSFAIRVRNVGNGAVDGSSSNTQGWRGAFT